MNIFKAAGTVINSAVNVLTKACEALEIFADSTKDVALMSKSTTGSMLQEMEAESAASLAELEASLASTNNKKK